MTIGIYGCGWLGKDLAIHFFKKNLNQSLNKIKNVVGSTTTRAKLETLSNLKIDPLYLNLTDEVECSDFSLLSSPDIFIINIPPKMKDQVAGTHFHQIQKLFEKIYNPEKKYIFVSSTSVYGEFQGEVTEETQCQPTSIQGEELLKIEKFLMEIGPVNITILRFGGLIDENRHPSKFLSGRKDITDAEAPVNLIHKVDCIGIIDRIISDQKWGEVYNGVSDEHTTRKAFYTHTCKIRGLPAPHFSDSGVYKNYKQVSNQKVRTLLKYKFTYPHLIDF